MPCKCSSGLCKTCQCSKSESSCSLTCHPNLNDSQCINLCMPEGFSDPRTMKVAQLRKELSSRGEYPEGMATELINKLQRIFLKEYELTKNNNSNSNNNNDNEINNSDKSNDSAPDGVSIAKQIIELGSGALHIFNLLNPTPPVTFSSNTNQLKKIYRQLSVLIHPDKLHSKFPQATLAFQLLVEAYESLATQQNITEDSKTSKGKPNNNVLTIMRSNNNCFTTIIRCPRCKIQWNTPLDGLEPISYTLMMMGVKSYTCSTCLLGFGCISAIHICPHCKKEFDYHPNDFNRQITCGNKNCNKPFGFFVTHVPERRLKELKAELLSIQQQRIKKIEAAEAREARANKRKVDPVPSIKNYNAKSTATATTTSNMKPKSLSDDDKAFLANLLNNCPRCGYEVDPEESSKSELKQHLDQCNDTKLHSNYQKKLQLERDSQEAKEHKQLKQQHTENLEVFKFLGANTSHLKLLEAPVLEQQAKLMGIDTSKKMVKQQLIHKVTEVAKQQKLLESGKPVLQLTDGGASNDKKNKIQNKNNHDNSPNKKQKISSNQKSTVHQQQLVRLNVDSEEEEEDSMSDY